LKEEILSDWLHNLPVVWLTAVFFGAAYLSAALAYAGVAAFARSLSRAKAFSASMLSPMGTLFALFVVFTAAQVWNDNDHAIAAVAQEASSLRAVLILADAFPPESRTRLQTLIRHHIDDSTSKEWPLMAHRSATLAIAPPHLADALQFTLSLTPATPGQGIAQREMALALESALEARRQRVLISYSAVSLVKWACLVIQALCVLIAIALSHDNRRASVIALGLFATGAAACLLLIGAYDRPFIGKLSIGPEPLLQVMPEAAAPR
jgi:hypothetical protein